MAQMSCWCVSRLPDHLHVLSQPIKEVVASCAKWTWIPVSIIWVPSAGFESAMRSNTQYLCIATCIDRSHKVRHNCWLGNVGSPRVWTFGPTSGRAHPARFIWYMPFWVCQHEFNVSFNIYHQYVLLQGLQVKHLSIEVITWICRKDNAGNWIIIPCSTWCCLAFLAVNLFHHGWLPKERHEHWNGNNWGCSRFKYFWNSSWWD